MKKFLLIVLIFAIAAVVGAALEPYVAKTFPTSTEKQFLGINDMVVALENKKDDAIVLTRVSSENVLEEKPNALQIYGYEIEFRVENKVSLLTDIEFGKNFLSRRNIFG